jgi:hypothetical protein
VAYNISKLRSNQADIDALVESAFQHYRSSGFPFYNLTPADKYRELQNLLNFDHSRIIANKTIEQKMHGLALAWSYFPRSWSVECGKMKTPMSIYTDDNAFRRALAKRAKWGITKFTDSEVRKAVRSFSGAQGVSNFKPISAAAVYHRYLGRHGGMVWDMSAGFGGRLLGAIACDHVSHYIGTDPCSATMNGLRSLARELGRDDLLIELHKIGSEDFRPTGNSLDLCFTSPPYFDTERYSDETTQSYRKYPGRQEWLHGFLGTTLDNCHYGLKRSGRLVINIANVRSYPALTADFLQMASSRGWKRVDTLQYSLSRMMGTRGNGNNGFKCEPIYVFAKR